MTGTKIEIEVEVVDKTGQGMADVRQKTVADARAAGAEIEQAFDKAAAGAASSFDGIASKVGSAFERTEQAGRQAGKQTGEGFADTLADAAGKIDISSIGSTISNALQSLGGKGGAVTGAAVAIGAIFADDFVSGFDQGFSANKHALDLQIQTGLGSAQLETIGEKAGKAWSAGFGDGLTELTRSAALLDNVLGDIDGVTPLQDAAKWATILNTHFGVDIPRSAEIAGRMINQGLARNTEESYNIMIGAAQRYQASYDEILDVTREFGTTFSELKITGAEAVDFIGQAWTRGLVPTIDRAGELFEEFIVEVQAGASGRAAPAIEAMGLSFDKVQQQLNSGQGKQAIIELAEQLLSMEDITYRNELAAQVFGTAIESAADKTAILELIAEVDNLGNSFDGVANDVADAAERSVTELDRLQRRVYDLASGAGEQTSRAVNEEIDGILWLWREAQRGGEDAFNEVDTKSSTFVDALINRMRLMGTDTSEVWDFFKERANEGTTAVESATDAVADLEQAVNDFSNRFASDRVMRELAADAAALTDAAAETEGQVFDLTDGFNMQTAEGRNLQAQFERLSLNLDDLAEGHRNGTVTSLQLAQGQVQVESTIRAVSRQLGLTAEDTQYLINKYGSVPSEVTTAVNEVGNALSRTEQLYQRLRGLDGTSYTTYINTQTTTSTRRSSGTHGGNTYLAHGGSVGGEPVAAAAGGGFGVPVMVNERGSEIARMPSGDIVDLPTGSTVMTAEDSHRFLNSGGGGSGITINLNIAGSVVSEGDLVERITAHLERTLNLGGLSR